VLDVLSFDASDRENETFVVTADYVKERLSAIVKDQDLSRYIL
jgi:ATP-dependent HslUV protease ATP-binding subunit HslU